MTVLRADDYFANGSFQGLAAALMANGGGEAVFSPKTYIVGSQDAAFAPAHVFTLHGVPGPVTLHGNGATLKLAPGLRFGTFKPDGTSLESPNGYTGPGMASPLPGGLFYIYDCAGAIILDGFNLDGSRDEFLMGGRWGDTGWQIGAHGLNVSNCTGALTIEDVTTINNGCDGVVLGTTNNAPKVLRRVVSKGNARQGLSIVGGTDYRIEDSKFSDTARGAFGSSPGAGCDLEAENAPNRKISFVRTEFANNAGCGLLADSGDTADVTCDECTITGTTSWAAWIHKPGFTFTKCTFNGPVIPHGDPDPTKATKFLGCTFNALDNPNSGFLIDAGGDGGANVLVDKDCVFNLAFGKQPIYGAVTKESAPPAQPTPSPPLVAPTSNGGGGCLGLLLLFALVPAALKVLL